MLAWNAIIKDNYSTPQALHVFFKVETSLKTRPYGLKMGTKLGYYFLPISKFFLIEKP